MQGLNLILALLGITKTSFFNEFAQQLVRWLFTFITISRVDPTKGPWVTTALLAFGLGETARYPYYFLKILGLDKTDTGLFLGHLRYNFFLIFYPLGSFADGMTHVFAAENMRKEGTWQLDLPNKYNISFDLPFICQYAIPVLYSVFFPINYSLLIKNRAKYYKEIAEKRVEKEKKE